MSHTNFMLKRWTATLIPIMFAIVSFAYADDPIPPDEPTPTPDELKRLISESLPAVIGTDNSKLVAQLLNPRLGPPISQTFNVDAAIKTLFGRGGAQLAPDCRKTTTPQGDLDRGVCRAFRGLEAGSGIYKELRFSKALALGDVGYVSRNADAPVDPASIKPIQLSDDQAYNKAIDFLASVFGVPKEEIPIAPPDAKFPLPVKTIGLGWAGDNQPAGAVPVEKVVMLQRGLFVNAGQNLDWVPGPGRAIVVMDDSGIKEALVRHWREVRPHPAATAANAKTRDELISEMVEDILKVSDGPVSTLNYRIMLTAIPSDSAVSFLLPAIQVAVSPVPNDLTEDEQAKVVATAGFLREYPLVRLVELEDDKP